MTAPAAAAVRCSRREATPATNVEERGAHAEYGGQGRRAAADAAAKQQEHQPVQHTGSQQDVRGLPGTALTGPLPKALLHQLFVPIGGAAEEDPGVFLVQTPGEHPD